MSVIHQIRLQGHWVSSPLPDGRTRHVRRFGRPRTLDSDESVWLCHRTTSRPLRVLVNGIELGQGLDHFAIDITPHIQPRNEVVLESSQMEPEWALVLEIRRESA